MALVWFPADVTKQGAVKFRVRLAWDSYVSNFAGGAIEVAVRALKHRRSVRQNAWWWGVYLPEVADHLGYDRHEHEGLHYELVKLWGGTHVDETSGLTLPNKRSSELTTEEFSDLMEWGVRFAAEKWNLYILLPSDVLTSKDKRPLITRPKARQAAHA